MIREAIAHHLSLGKSSQEEGEILRRIDRRQAARNSFFKSLPDKANQGFIRIERVATSDPVTLFGQNVPSYAHNRIIISLGKDGPDGKRQPARALMTALISDESLTNLVLNQGRSSKNIGVTAESFGDIFLPKKRASGRKSSHDLFEEMLDQHFKEKNSIISSLSESVSRLTRAISKESMKSFSWMIDKVIDTSSESFWLKRHAENLQKDLVQYRVEASSAALNIRSISRDAEQKLLGSDPESAEIDLDLARYENPLLDAAMERFRSQEALILREAIISYMKKKIDDHHPEASLYSPGLDDPQGHKIISFFAYNDRKLPRVKELESMAMLISSLGNESRNARRDAVDGYSLTASCSMIYGGGDNLHSLFPINDTGYVRVSFLTATIEERFGNEDIWDGSSILEVGISGEDLMTALRGHPSGLDIPCSIDRLMGVGIPRTPTPGALSKSIEQGSYSEKLVSAHKEMRQIAEDAKSLIHAGLKSKSDRDALTSKVAELVDLFVIIEDLSRDNMMGRAQDMTHQVQNMAREAFEEIDQYVLKEHGVSLMQIRNSHEDDAPGLT